MTQKNILIYQERIGLSISALVEEVRQVAGTEVKDPLISFRVKDPETLKKKMLHKNTNDVFSIDDVYGVRILVGSVGEAYKILDRVSQAFPGYLDHDFFKEPKTSPSVNGKVLRLLQFIAYKNGVPFEIQITTMTLNEVNELLHGGYHQRKYRS